MKTLNRMFIATALVATSVHAFAEVTWDAVKKKIADGKSYSVEYKYDGPKGKQKIDYRTVVPDHIRSELKESDDQAKVGAVVVYDASWKQVRVKTGGGIIPRNLDHADVKDSALIKPVFTLILDQVGAGNKPTVTAEGEKTRFEFKTGSGRYTIWARANGDISKTERIDSSAKGKEVRDFGPVQWNNNPSTGF
ncbi:MAG: hypothetical protein KF760_13970 [Candidatus Eremiobacteraeota bacterium]|nr:hypothetical protein [Candidatus Eremiobacteraeota bacterium]MCW5868980.1 hypothetical protein [Candidatus Eremiobacteraeota bacterium]